jgi:hypothetical protein
MVIEMPPKGSRNNKRVTTPLRTHSGGLPLHIQRLILLDLEQHSDIAPGDIVALRPSLYGDLTTDSAKLRRSVRDRIVYLRGLKQSDPEAFWYGSLFALSSPMPACTNLWLLSRKLYAEACSEVVEGEVDSYEGTPSPPPRRKLSSPPVETRSPPPRSKLAPKQKIATKAKQLIRPRSSAPFGKMADYDRKCNSDSHW